MFSVYLPLNWIHLLGLLCTAFLCGGDFPDSQRPRGNSCSFWRGDPPRVGGGKCQRYHVGGVLRYSTARKSGRGGSKVGRGRRSRVRLDSMHILIDWFYLLYLGLAIRCKRVTLKYSRQEAQIEKGWPVVSTVGDTSRSVALDLRGFCPKN